MFRTVLLVDSDADRLAAPLARAVDGLAVTACTTLAAARAHLIGTPFDVVLSSAQVGDGLAVSLLELDRALALPPLLVRTDSLQERADAEGAGASLAFVASPDARVLGAVVAWYLGISVAPEPVGTPQESDARRAALEDVSLGIARVTHAINNPLSVIIGNVQLVRELFRAAPGDPMIGESLGDIETASRELVALMEDLGDLRRQAEQ